MSWEQSAGINTTEEQEGCRKWRISISEQEQLKQQQQKNEVKKLPHFRYVNIFTGTSESLSKGFPSCPHYNPIAAILIIVLHAASANDQRAPQRQRRRYAAGPSVIEGAGSTGRMQRPRNKRMYALCPPQFQRIWNECYYMSKEKANWLDAQFKCQDMDSKLAEPNKVDDRRLRKYFHGVAHGEWGCRGR